MDVTTLSTAPQPQERLLSLDLIRGFVAVGRRMSITLASQDLCLTQSAVSRQINALEEQLGVDLELEDKIATVGELVDFVESKLD